MITLRSMQSDDEAKIDAWAICIESHRFMSRYRPNTDTTLCRIIQHNRQDIGYIWIEAQQDDSTEGLLGIMIGDQRYWNKGFGQQAIDLIVAEAELNLRIDSVILRVRSQNIRAYQCYLSCGFVVTGHAHKVAPSGESFPIVTMQRPIVRRLTMRCSERSGRVTSDAWASVAPHPERR